MNADDGLWNGAPTAGRVSHETEQCGVNRRGPQSRVRTPPQRWRANNEPVTARLGSGCRSEKRESAIGQTQWRGRRCCEGACFDGTFLLLPEQEMRHDKEHPQRTIRKWLHEGDSALDQGGAYRAPRLIIESIPLLQEHRAGRAPAGTTTVIVCTWPTQRNHRMTLSATQPVRRLDEKHIIRARSKEILVVTPRREVSEVTIALIARLRPHEKQRRRWSILPA